MANWNTIRKELKISTSRSSGAGGQHVNKVETRVRACLNIIKSAGLSPEEKASLLESKKIRKSKSGDVCSLCQSSRNQQKNKKLAIERLLKRLEKALKPEAKRHSTKVPKAEKEKRLQHKKSRSEIKTLRKKIDY